MAYRITIELPLERFNNLGILRLYDGRDRLLIGGIPCYGKADSQRAAKEGNAARDPRLPYGDTPLGLYAPAKILRYKPRHRVFGQRAILLDPVKGQALTAKENGRSGLAIHGGRGNFSPAKPPLLGLRATYGCVRIADDHFIGLDTIIGDEEIAEIRVMDLV